MSTSFAGIFQQGGVMSIEIPRLQRDYAQGRQDGEVPRIRKSFLKVLHEALTGGSPVGLDFVYGEVKNGRMIPLDGQQRLTTLFLIHWYLVARNEISGMECTFLGKFTYTTRYSARHFCEELITQRPPFPLATVSGWLRDQRWYAGAWKNDPTIQGMLVVLDEVHKLFKDVDSQACLEAWRRLVSLETPAITFECLSLPDMGLTDELYIKMNSRGKPLTPFEHFKANFEHTLRDMSETYREMFGNRETHYQEFIHKVDQTWSDLLWPLRGSDDIIDDEFLRLFRFITEVVIHRHGLTIDPGLFDEDIDLWAESVYGKENKKDPLASQRYLFDVLDSLFAEFGRMKTVTEIADWFGKYFSEKDYRTGAVVIFDKTDLFTACCMKYGSMEGQNRAFSLSRTLLLFAVIEYLMSKPRQEPEALAIRLRVLRNLVIASDNEIRLDRFGDLLNETALYVCSGDLSELKTYNKRQLEEERIKAGYLTKYSTHDGLCEILHRLEDHDLLRGCLATFDFNVDASIFVRRAVLFNDLFLGEVGSPSLHQVGAALLACGDYSRETSDGRFQFGSPALRSVWRQLLANPASDEFARTSKVLLRMLDALANAVGESIPVRLKWIVDNYLARQEEAQRFDWRYYLVKYDLMRTGQSGLFISSSGKMGFDLCMMEKRQLNSYYRDPYLSAIIKRSGINVGPDVKDPYYYGWDGYRPEGRWIELVSNGDKIMSCRQNGIQLQAPSQTSEHDAFTTIVKKYGLGSDMLLQIPQVTVEGSSYDQEDRIQVGANLLREIVAGQASATAVFS